MRVLVACEESQRVCAAFRAKGHEAYSADIQEPSGGRPEWHILGDVTEVLTPNDVHRRGVVFYTMDGERHAFMGVWDLIIAHPPCTYLSFAGNRSLAADATGERRLKLNEAANFFLKFVVPAEYGTKVCIENPLGWMNKYFRPADQIIHPFYFSNPFKSGRQRKLCEKAYLPMAFRSESVKVQQATNRTSCFMVRNEKTQQRRSKKEIAQ